MTKLVVLGAIAACTEAAPPPPMLPAAIAIPAPPPPAPLVVLAPAPELEQPAAVKLRLGHYRNARRGIGVTIDLTEKNESIALPDPAKLRFDGEATIWRLEGQPGGNDRIDYVRDGGRVMLHIWKNGDIAVYVPDPDGKPSEAIHLVRDGDADPL